MELRAYLKLLLLTKQIKIYAIQLEIIYQCCCKKWYDKAAKSKNTTSPQRKSSKLR